MIVLDAGVLANALADDHEDGGVARAVLRAAGGLSAPDLIDVETVAVLRKRWIAGALGAARFEAAIDDLRDLDIDRYPALPLMRRAFELRDNVTAYDAVYVALAEALRCELVTVDARLADSPGPACAIRLLTRQA